MKQAFTYLVELVDTESREVIGYSPERTGVIFRNTNAGTPMTVSPHRDFLVPAAGIFVPASEGVSLTQKQGFGALAKGPLYGILASPGTTNIVVTELFG